MNLKKDLHHYKAQNTHLNQLNENLVNSNHMISKYIEEINSNYAELVQVAEEAAKRRKMSQETNGKLLNYSNIINNFRRKFQLWRKSSVDFEEGLRRYMV